MKGREAWEHARVSVLDSVLHSSHHLSHVLIKLSMENPMTLDGAVLRIGSWILLRWGKEFYALLSPFSV